MRFCAPKRSGAARSWTHPSRWQVPAAPKALALPPAGRDRGAEDGRGARAEALAGPAPVPGGQAAAQWCDEYFV